MEQMDTADRHLKRNMFPWREQLTHAWEQRTLLWQFLRRDLQARYVGSSMGFFWSVINPLILLALYTFVFGCLIHPDFGKRYLINQDSMVEKALYIFCGLLPWYAFQESIVRMTTSLVDNRHLIRQIRFPAKLIPTYLALSSVVNQLIGSVFLLGAVWWVRGQINPSLWTFPLILLLQTVLVFGLGLFLSTLHVYVRDTAPLVVIGVMITMWTTPLFYSLDQLPDPYKTVILINPLTHLIELYHNVFLGDGGWSSQFATHWTVVILTALFAFLVGYRIFTRSHAEFVDVI